MLEAIISGASNIIGGLLGSRDRAKDLKFQKAAATQGVQWKVADAKKAGIHPLYALGAQTFNPTPVSTGSADLGSGIAAAGQDLARGITAASDSNQRTNAYTAASQTLALKRADLENQLLASQIAKINQPGTPPAPQSLSSRYLIDGQGSLPMGIVQTSPMSRAAAAPENLAVEPAAITDVGYARTPAGNYTPVMSGDVKQRLEEDFPGMVLWNIRNRLLPSVGINQAPPPVPVPEGYDAWVYNPFTQSYTPHTRSWTGLYY